jgi:hypothetical protein
VKALSKVLSFTGFNFIRASLLRNLPQQNVGSLILALLCSFNKPQVNRFVNDFCSSFLSISEQKMLRTTPALFRSLSRQLPLLSAQSQRGYAKDLRFGPEGRKAMLVGVDLLADAVAVTMGPKVGAALS